MKKLTNDVCSSDLLATPSAKEHRLSGVSSYLRYYAGSSSSPFIFLSSTIETLFLATARLLCSPWADRFFCDAAPYCPRMD